MRKNYNFVKMFVSLFLTFALILSLSGCSLMEWFRIPDETTLPLGFVPGTVPSGDPTLGTSPATTPSGTGSVEDPEATVVPSVPVTEPAVTEPVVTEPVVTEPVATEPIVTEPVATEPIVTEPAVTEPVVTEPAVTEPVVTEPAVIEPIATEPVATEPAVTEPAHTHSYTSKVYAPTCTEKGYTKYTCSCGKSYTDNTVAAKGHSYSASKTVDPTCSDKGYTQYACSTCGKTYKDNHKDALGHNMNETERKEATTSEEGYILHTCSRCGKTETTVLEKVKEVIDIKALESYGRQYAVSEHGYEVEYGLRAGYYPAIFCKITSMEEGKYQVRGAIDSNTEQLIALGNGRPICFVLPDGTIARVRFDIEIVHEYDDYYRIWVYYG